MRNPFSRSIEPGDMPDGDRSVTVAEVKRLMRGVLAAMAIFGAMMTAALGLSYYNLNEIQQSRFQSWRESCQETNERNVAALAKLEDIGTIGPVPAGEREAAVRATRDLIGELVPQRADCEAYARARVRDP